VSRGVAAPAPKPPAGSRHRRLPRPKWVLIIAVLGMFVSAVPLEINPPADHPVDLRPLYDTGTDRCWTPASG
jgi:hypothetical protein